MNALVLSSVCTARPRSAARAQLSSPRPLSILPHASARLAASARGACLRRSQASRQLRVVAAAASAGEPGPGEGKQEQKSLAPTVPVSPVGEFLTHMLNMEPLLFDDAVDQQLNLLAQQAAAEGTEPSAAAGGTDIVLYKRINELKKSQRQKAVQDLMYFSVIKKFLDLGVDMLPPLDGSENDLSHVDLNALTKGVHSQEALEMVREHLSSILGAGGVPANSYSNVLIRMSKMQAAQVFAASLMFGYFLRRVDHRFQLERQLGTLGQGLDDQVKALEELFAGADDKAEGGKPSRKASLRKYIETFDSKTLAETASIVSMEGIALVERQTTGLFGSIEALQRQMQEAIGPVETPQELQQKIAEAVQSGKVQVLTLTYATQRRVILEAVAFGSFLRDVEMKVAREPALLTPTPAGARALGN